jgi:RpiR family transcriptional regulator, carbohydrate utilization regulator
MLDRIRYHERGYTAVEEAIARAVLADPKRAIAESIEKFADRVGVSAGSVVRFAQLFGFPGYRAFKYELSAALGTAAISGVGGGRFEHSIQALQFADRTLDAGALRSAGEIIALSRRVEILGVGAASACARALEFALTIRGAPARRIADPREAAAASGFLGRGEALIAISHSGRTRDTVDGARRARATGATVVVITSSPRSPLGKLANVLLGIDASATRYGTLEFPFRIVHLAIAQALGDAVDEALSKEERGARTAIWASARFDLRYGDVQAVNRTANEPEH